RQMPEDALVEAAELRDLGERIELVRAHVEVIAAAGMPLLRKRAHALRDHLPARRDRRSLRAAVHLPFLVHQVEAGLRRPRGLRFSEEEITDVTRERIREQIEHFLLELGLEVDEDVATDDEIDARERRSAREILLPEDHHLPEPLRDAIALAERFEIF